MSPAVFRPPTPAWDERNEQFCIRCSRANPPSIQLLRAGVAEAWAFADNAVRPVPRDGEVERRNVAAASARIGV